VKANGHPAFRAARNHTGELTGGHDYRHWACWLRKLGWLIHQKQRQKNRQVSPPIILPLRQHLTQHQKLEQGEGKTMAVVAPPNKSPTKAQSLKREKSMIIVLYLSVIYVHIRLFEIVYFICLQKSPHNAGSFFS